LYRGTRSITCYHLDIVKDSNELTLHLVEALYAHLMNKNINTKRQLNFNADTVTNDNKSTGNASMRSLPNSLGGQLSRRNNVGVGGSINGSGDVDEENEMSELEKKILGLVKNPIYLTTDEGCHVEEVLRKLSQFQPNDIKSAIQRLSDDGQLYSTIDEEHYKPTH